jgi:hypothetical protein
MKQQKILICFQINRIKHKTWVYKFSRKHSSTINESKNAHFNLRHEASFIPWNDWNIQGVPGGKVSILGGHNIGHSKQKKTVYVHVSYSELFPR